MGSFWELVATNNWIRTAYGKTQRVQCTSSSCYSQIKPTPRATNKSTFSTRPWYQRPSSLTNLRVGCRPTKLELSLFSDGLPLPSCCPAFVPAVAWDACRKFSVKMRYINCCRNRVAERNLLSLSTLKEEFKSSPQTTIATGKQHHTNLTHFSLAWSKRTTVVRMRK